MVKGEDIKYFKYLLKLLIASPSQAEAMSSRTNSTDRCRQGNGLINVKLKTLINFIPVIYSFMHLLLRSKTRRLRLMIMILHLLRNSCCWLIHLIVHILGRITFLNMVDEWKAWNIILFWNDKSFWEISTIERPWRLYESNFFKFYEDLKG